MVKGGDDWPVIQVGLFPHVFCNKFQKYLRNHQVTCCFLVQCERPVVIFRFKNPNPFTWPPSTLFVGEAPCCCFCCCCCCCCRCCCCCCCCCFCCCCCCCSILLLKDKNWPTGWYGEYPSNAGRIKTLKRLKSCNAQFWISLRMLESLGST